MQLTTKARYAITSMLDLAINHDNKPIKLCTIAKRQNISLSYLEQISTKLRKNNLIKSVRGPGGGYLINQDIEISINDIIEAVDENIDLRRCKGLKNCNGGKKCMIHNLWCELSSQIKYFLDNKSLNDVISEYNHQEHQKTIGI